MQFSFELVKFRKGGIVREEGKTADMLEEQEIIFCNVN